MRMIPPTAMLIAMTTSAVAADGDVQPTKLAPTVSKSSIRMAPTDQIRVTNCSSTKRTEITGVVGHPTTFTFGPDEQIYQVLQTKKLDDAGGISEAGWLAQNAEELAKHPLGNTLPLWPMTPGYSTMTITTCKTGVPGGAGGAGCGKIPDAIQKVYPFRLQAINELDGSANNNDVTLNLICRSGAEHRVASAVPSAAEEAAAPAPTATKVASRRKRQRQAETEAAAERIRTEAFNRVDGVCRFSPKGPSGSPLTPLCPMSNGIWTLMRFQGVMPTVFISDPAYLCGADNAIHERRAQQFTARDFVVIQETAQRFCLRLGTDVLQIDNHGYDPGYPLPENGTIAPADSGVHRKVLKASR